MIIDDDMEREAAGRAHALLNGLDEEGRWRFVLAQLRDEVDGRRERVIQELVPGMVREIVAPGTTHKDWFRRDMSRVMNDRMTPERFVHNLRLLVSTGMNEKPADDNEDREGEEWRAG